MSETSIQKVEPKTELVKTEQSARQTRLAAFTPVNLTEAIALAKMMAASDIVPKDYKGKAANILVAIQFGSEIGLPPMQSLQSIAVINGRPSLWGDGALALIQGHPDFEDIQESDTGKEATCVIKRRGRSPVIRKFSDEDAQKAGLLSKPGPWVQYRARMRQMRARGFAMRDSFADVLKGVSIAEEAMDIPVDTSPVKQQREAMTLDVSALTPSTEPNRGHNDTNLNQTQPQKKQEDVLCANCGKINGHEDSCPEYEKAQQDAKTSKPTTKAAYMIIEVQKRTKKGSNQKYLVLEVVAPDNSQGKLFVWHQSMFEHFEKAKGESCLLEIATNEQQGKTYYSVEHIVELGGIKFVNDVPAQEGEMPAEEEPF